LHRATLPHKILEVVSVGSERSAAVIETAIVAPMATHDPGPIRYEHVLQKAPRRFWWLGAIAAVVAVVGAVLLADLRIQIGLYWLDLRPFIVSATALSYAYYFFAERPRVVRGTAALRGGVLVDVSSEKPVVGRRNGNLSALSICSDPRVPGRLLAAGNFSNGDELILGAPAELLVPLRQVLDVPASGTGWLTFAPTPRFPIGATLQWLASLVMAASSIAVFVADRPNRELLFMPIQMFAIIAFSSMFLRTKPQPFLAVGMGGIRAIFATNNALGRWRDDRILPWSAIAEVETHGARQRFARNFKELRALDRIEIVEMREGGYLRSTIQLPRLGAETRAVIDGQLQDAVRRAHGAVAMPTGNDALALLAPQNGEEPAAWRARLEVAATTSGYRGGDRDVEAWAQAVVDPDAPPKVRVAAGFLLTRVAPERTGEVSGILEDLRDEEARALAHAVLPRGAGHRNDL
jgi:hypothetical protein